MAQPKDIQPPAAVAGLRLPTRRVETAVLLRIALPLAGAYLAEFAMFLTSRMVVGRLGYRELAAVGQAGELAFELLVVLMALLSVVGVLVAHAEGAGQPAAAGQAARQGFLVATLLAVPATLFVWNLDALLSVLGQDPAVVTLMPPYQRALAGMVLPLLWFAVLRNFVAALARTGAVMVITLAALALNLLLTFGLVEGRFGLPALGLAGAGWATTIVHWSMLLALFVYVYCTPLFRGYGLFFGRLRVLLPVWYEILRLGLPVAGLAILESSLFAAVSILSGTLGAVELATYQVISAWIGVPFVMAHGMAEAAMVRVSFAVGRGSHRAARQAGVLGMLLTVGFLAALVAVPLQLPEVLVRIFLRPDDPGFAEVAALVARLMYIAALFQVFDGLQVVAAMALRGLKDTLVPLWLAAVGYWVLGIGGGCLLAFALGLGADGLWWGLALGLFVTGTLLAWRFLWLTKRLAAT
ncbi:MAG TPA: MATE family efflux transporter [Kiloniellaceae bacterium]|nr:MATE family efflux transporter [Kiloniellaceae bacterium]